MFSIGDYARTEQSTLIMIISCTMDIGYLCCWIL